MTTTKKPHEKLSTKAQLNRAGNNFNDLVWLVDELPCGFTGKSGQKGTCVSQGKCMEHACMRCRILITAALMLAGRYP